MKQYKTISDLKDHAKEVLTGKFGGAVLTNIIPGLVTFAFTFIFSMISSFILTINIMASNPNAMTDMTAMESGLGLNLATYIFSQVLTVFIGVFNTGIALYFLNLACGRTASTSDLFYGFKHMFKESLTISLIMTVINTVCLMPYNVFYMLYTTEGSTKWLIYTIVALCAGLIVYLPISLSLSQSYFLLLDFPKYSAKEILLLSIRIMKGRKWKLFLLELSFVPLMLLGLLSFGLGELWITPYKNMTLALYFLDIMKPENTGTGNTENIQE